MGCMPACMKVVERLLPLVRACSSSCALGHMCVCLSAGCYSSSCMSGPWKQVFNTHAADRRRSRRPQMPWSLSCPAMLQHCLRITLNYPLVPVQGRIRLQMLPR